ncbi:MAG: helix-turn-helix domain-containing protein [Flavobacterium sp.]
MRTIYTNHDNTCITDISKQLMMSTRHFEHKFKEEFGFTPKKFQVVSRFESTLRKLLLSEKADYLQTVLDSGYYDQSHFIKECKSHTNLSPTDTLKYKEDSLHFYFKKLG